uniref:Secreted protein n=1 Tax=Heterorhabditis bacteriophora TaxID=37862 RepID=A0A1I7WLL0_HETBA
MHTGCSVESLVMFCCISASSGYKHAYIHIWKLVSCPRFVFRTRLRFMAVALCASSSNKTYYRSNMKVALAERRPPWE